MRLTVAQALVRFLAAQHSERDGVRRRLVDAVWGIFGHGNVAGLGQALLEERQRMRFLQGRNEQAMVHAATGFSRHSNRLRVQAVTTSIGPGATNLVTGAALATVNRLPVLLLPGDTFAGRPAEPVLQQLESPVAGDISVNDCLRPVSRYFDRITRPEQLIPAALRAMRVLTDPADTGAVTLALPQDVQAEAYDWPVEFFAERTWHVRRPPAEPAALAAIAAALRTARRPLLVAGGGVRYAEAEAALATFAEATGVPVATTQAGKGALPGDHEQEVGGIGHTGTEVAAELARTADLVLGVGTRWSDFTTASHTLFAHPGVRFVNLNVAAPDSAKLAALPLVADARAGLEALTEELAGHRVDADYLAEYRAGRAEADRQTAELCAAPGPDARPTQAQLLGELRAQLTPEDVIVNAAGSLPGDLHRHWRADNSRQYHLEYGYSCMGYEIPAALGVKLASPGAGVWALVGDGTYLMLPGELVTAVQEGLDIRLVLVQNHGYASIGGLSEATGGERFGTDYRYRDAEGGYTGDPLPVDLAANAASLGLTVRRAATVGELREALAAARTATGPFCVYVETGPPAAGGPAPAAWWDVPVAEVAARPAARAARTEYERRVADRVRHL
ncbi:3D-(3,5/4)-trihydroxycyclohexane-1,2-dione acylhydrolase (decyclizing) [Streptomyces sp. P38-E01]|uniref:3D-(3,5/4)-trihydroxycyclohexane-1,2-dione acylhydrolase (Decyclizing) n=1 Tax=Streptomyces tardus TaxID=2780544 RepID=A0A949JF48_9ACTN|nr:3D-(3,5/4)-trihydroxycyclohexane-1,2-dione acylhydrolase (decyclizing) [Streptomyces tardus]MBU7598841.1 3D-(3,5/4)-trihydroxycyclohexane-1,2-dione acylhydrolase (decyclizing) [Streptomyces tardus]